MNKTQTEKWSKAWLALGKAAIPQRIPQNQTRNRAKIEQNSSENRAKIEQDSHQIKAENEKKSGKSGANFE